MTSQPLLLSELCSTCNIKTPQYKCPRCSTRTCSLQCYKRHQQWAQCSGKRDPTTFVKAGQLVTPAGLDHDYNFITGIERVVDQADKDAKEMLSLPPKSSPEKGSNLAEHLEACRVIIEKAPIGLSRQKNNKTRWSSKGKCVWWTIEWIHEDDTRDLAELREFKPLSIAYGELLHMKRPKRRKLEHERHKDAPAPPPSPKRIAGSADDMPELPNEATVALISSVKTEPRETTTTVNEPGQSREGEGEQRGRELNIEMPPLSRGHPQKIQVPTDARDATEKEALQKSQGQAHERYFYLVKPRTSGSKRVLVPVLASQSLSDCLRNQVVLEFPTVQVLSYPPEALPEGFIHEDDYFKWFRAENKRLADLAAQLDSSVPLAGSLEGESSDGLVEPSTLDDEKIMAVIKQDLASSRQNRQAIARTGS